MAILASSIPHCERVPQACRRKSIFLIESKCPKDIEDVKSDLNCVFQECFEVKHRPVSINSAVAAFNVKVFGKGSCSDLSNGQTIMHTHRRENDHGLIRHIVWFTKNDIVLHNTIMCTINSSICGPVDEITFTVKKHGNSKSDGTFYPIKKSMMTGLKTMINTCGGKRKIYDLYNEACNSSGSGDHGDSPRNKKQCQNIALRFSPQTREVESILAFNEELAPDSIVWYCADITSDLWVLGNNFMKKLLTNAALTEPVSCDTTFNFGAFEVTPFA